MDEPRGPLSLTNQIELMEFGKTLKKYVKDNDLSVVIQGKDYPCVDAWKFAGNAFGLTALCDEPISIAPPGTLIWTGYAMIKHNKGGKTWEAERAVYSSSTEPSKDLIEKLKIFRTMVKDYYAYKCACRIENLLTGRIVSTGFATCSNAELIKAGFEEYAIYSMSQTRTIGKGYRNVIGFVMKDAGFEATPAEEMEGTKPPADSPKPGKPIMSEAQFEKTEKALNAGKVTLEVVLKHYDFKKGSNHEKKLKALDKKIKKGSGAKFAEAATTVLNHNIPE